MFERTPFPIRPRDVVPLTRRELTEGPEYDASLQAVCRRFRDDPNRALVWLIRFGALRAWRERPDMAAWIRAQGPTVGEMCDVAAHFELNDLWGFDPEPFRAAVNRQL